MMSSRAIPRGDRDAAAAIVVAAPTAAAPSSSRRRRKATLSVLLAAAFVLSALLASSSSGGDSLAGDELRRRRPTLPRAPDDDVGGGRRFLLLDEDQTFEVDLDDEGWGGPRRRRLLAPKDEAWQRILEAANNDGLGDGKLDEDAWRPRRKMPAVRVPRYADKHHFDECVGKTVDECQTLIDAYVAEHTEQFNNRTSLRMELRKIREITDESYYKVVLRTDITGQVINGVFDDGVVAYPWPWTVEGEARLVGPWNCTAMAPDDCCFSIQQDVADPDDSGHFMACFVEEPVGSLNNPERDDRAITVVDADLMVVRAPIAH